MIYFITVFQIIHLQYPIIQFKLNLEQFVLRKLLFNLSSLKKTVQSVFGMVQ